MLCSCLSVVLWAAVSGAEEALPWWKTATFYEIFPRSFKDSDGDGIGDLRGIVQNLDYFKELGVDAVWLTPIFQSPMVDFGYDISNFTEIAPMFGNMGDFDALLAKAKSIGLKLLIDFVPNHTSDEHVWFQYSKDPSHPLYEHYKDFYIWHDAAGTSTDGKHTLPNNWLSVFGGPAWTWCEQRQQFYMHQFASKQPDLNFRNPYVVGNMTSIMNYWLDKGIDGFRIDAVKHLFEDANFTDEMPNVGMTGDVWDSVNHTSTTNQPETFQQLKDWSDLLYQRSLKDGRDLVMFLEVYGPVDISMKYYGNGKEASRIPFNFRFFEIANLYTGPMDIKYIIEEWMSQMPSDSAPNWVLGNHDLKRLPNMYSPDMVDAIHLVTGVLPGVKIVYYGEEIGMDNAPVSWAQTVDPWARNLGSAHYQERSRDFVKTPMQWDDSPNAGFSNSTTTWLPVNPNYWTVNVAYQRAAARSHLKVFQALTKARKDPVLQRGDLKVLVPENYNDTLVVVRSYKGSFYMLIVNLGSYPVSYTSQNLFSPQGLDQDLTTVVGSVNSVYMPGMNFLKGSQKITLRPKGSILLRSGTSHASSSASPTLSNSRSLHLISTTILFFLLLRFTP